MRTKTMTRKDYRLIAKAIKENSHNINDLHVKNVVIIDKLNLIYDLCVIFKNDNNNFNTSKFIDFINDVD
jgi:hypothetical protein